MPVSRCGFLCEMYVFRRSYYKGTYQDMRILHLSTMLDIAWPQMYDTLQNVANEGFRKTSYDRAEAIKPWTYPDIIIIGCHSTDLRKLPDILDNIEKRHGIFREWDVLIYFIDDKIPFRAHEILKGCGVISQFDFSKDAICLINHHLRRRHDVISRRGAYVTMERKLTESLDHVVKPNQQKDSLGRKVNQFNKELSEKIHCEHSKDLILVKKILDFLLKVRNWNAHPNEELSNKNRKNAWEDLKKQISECEFKFNTRIHDKWRPVPKTPDAQDYHDYMKYILMFTFMIKDWLEEFAKRNKQNSASTQSHA